MPSLDWIGKKAVLNHHKEVPFHLLRCDPDLSVGEPDSGNLLVQGDNLLALKALLPYYAGQVRCIYIDPPYNTGNEKWVYNDNVNSPEMKEWLGKVVGMESEDLSRHDKWLCMMYPRLRLLKDFLAEDGVIFISIKDEELANILQVCNEIFYSINRIAVLIYHAKRGGGNDREFVAMEHEYIICYAKNKTSCEFNKRLIGKNALDKKDEKGLYRRGRELNKWGADSRRDDRPSMFYAIPGPDGKEVYPVRNDGTEGRWRKKKETMFRLAKEGDIEFEIRKDGTYIAYEKIRESNYRFTQHRTILSDVGTNADATNELKQIFGEKKFDTPKPTNMIRHLIDLVCDDDSFILDSFAGSGTTGHAVLAQNKADGGNRRFILVEMDKEICSNVTAQRLARVSQGYKDIEPLGGGFQYCRIGETLFDSSGQIAGTVSFIDLARFVFLKETGLPLPDEISGKSPLIGIHNGIAVYLLYNGVLDDKTAHGGNALTRAVLDILPLHSGPKIIYGTSCRVGESRLMQEQITFRQIPYALKVD